MAGLAASPNLLPAWHSPRWRVAMRRRALTGSSADGYTTCCYRVTQSSMAD